MGLFAQADGQSAQAPLPSNLFPMLFERLRLDKRLVVMDVGPATRSTVAFFQSLQMSSKFR